MATTMTSKKSQTMRTAKKLAASKAKAKAKAEAEEVADELELDLDLDALAASDDEGEEAEVELDVVDLPMDLDMGDEEELDLTGASDEEVIAVFKKMSDEDEVEVVKDEDGIHLTDKEAGTEYYIKEGDEHYEESYDKMDEEKDCLEEEAGCGKRYEEGYDKMEEEIVYEIELSEEDHMEEGEDHMEEGEEHSEMKEEEVEESTRRTRADRRRRDLKPSNYPTNESRRTRKPRIAESRRTSNVRKESYEKLLKEYEELKSKNGEYKEALKVFKTKINEVALFNQNLAHVTKLFTEHSTTKKEKMTILGRFDEIETIKESKSLYKTIAAELTEKSPITESVDKKVNKTIDSSKSNLNESTAYVDPQINKIKDLMNRIAR